MLSLSIGRKVFLPNCYRYWMKIPPKKARESIVYRYWTGRVYSGVRNFVSIHNDDEKRSRKRRRTFLITDVPLISMPVLQFFLANCWRRVLARPADATCSLGTNTTVEEIYIYTRPALIFFSFDGTTTTQQWAALGIFYSKASSMAVGMEGGFWLPLLIYMYVLFGV